FARLAKAVALDRPRKHHGRTAGMLRRRQVGVVDLQRIVSADRQLLQIRIREMSHHLEQSRVATPEVLAKECPVFDGVSLVFAVDDLAHPLDEQALMIPRKERIPGRSPKDFDDVPASAPEDRFELLHDLAVAANRAVEPLQVAVDDEDQVVELLARGERDRAERLRLVRLAVAEKRPDLLIRWRLEPAVLEVLRRAGLVN